MRGILLGLADVLGIVIYGFQILVFIHWILWLVGADPYNPIVRLIRGLVDPVLAWLRARLPFLVQGAWDLTPLAAILICVFLNRALVVNLHQLAGRF
jgi:uncharacterized protein YggT (Ycf19 family)